MKCAKLLGLAAVVVIALMAFAASSASGTTLLSGGAELKSGDTIDFSIPSGKSVAWVNTKGEGLDECAVGTVMSSLSSRTTGSLNSFTWENCWFPTKTITFGRIEITGGSNTEGTVKADATIQATVNTVFFGSCIYGFTSGTPLGTVNGNPALFTLNAVAEKFVGSNFACPETAKWTGTYNSTEPAELHVEP